MRSKNQTLKNKQQHLSFTWRGKTIHQTILSKTAINHHLNLNILCIKKEKWIIGKMPFLIYFLFLVKMLCLVNNYQSPHVFSARSAAASLSEATISWREQFPAVCASISDLPSEPNDSPQLKTLVLNHLLPKNLTGCEINCDSSCWKSLMSQTKRPSRILFL